MNKDSHVAIIMSVYKSDDCSALINALDSLVNQSLSCDIFLYRDGPVPQDLQLTLNHYSSYSNIFYYESGDNQGLAVALNYLINKTLEGNYKYIARMDSDDISHVNRIEKQVIFLEKNSNVDVCGTFCKEFGASYASKRKSLPLDHSSLLDFSITRCPFIHPTVMFRSIVFAHGHRYPVDTALTEDMALWFELLTHGYRFGNLDEVLLDYRLNENTIERRKGLNKALSEVNLRIKFMFKLNRLSVRNIFLILSRIPFHLLPNFIIKFMYKFCR